MYIGLPVYGCVLGCTTHLPFYVPNFFNTSVCSDPAQSSQSTRDSQKDGKQSQAAAHVDGARQGFTLPSIDLKTDTLLAPRAMPIMADLELSPMLDDDISSISCSDDFDDYYEDGGAMPDAWSKRGYKVPTQQRKPEIGASPKHAKAQRKPRPGLADTNSASAVAPEQEPFWKSNLRCSNVNRQGRRTLESSQTRDKPLDGQNMCFRQRAVRVHHTAHDHATIHHEAHQQLLRQASQIKAIKARIFKQSDDDIILPQHDDNHIDVEDQLYESLKESHDAAAAAAAAAEAAAVAGLKDDGGKHGRKMIHGANHMDWVKRMCRERFEAEWDGNAAGEAADKRPYAACESFADVLNIARKESSVQIAEIQEQEELLNNDEIQDPDIEAYLERAVELTGRVLTKREKRLIRGLCRDAKYNQFYYNLPDFFKQERPYGLGEII